MDLGESRKLIAIKDVELAISKIVEERAPLFTERITCYTEKEQMFLKVLARIQKIETPIGKDFLRPTGLSAGGSASILKRLEDPAMIYRSSDGYVSADPSEEEFLRENFR